MYWAGAKPGRVHRRTSAEPARQERWMGETRVKASATELLSPMHRAPKQETRWIVPVRPYKAPAWSWENEENIILTCAGVAAILFALIVVGAM